MTSPAHIRDRADFGSIRYANCWEDAGILCEALDPGPGSRILSIASAGDNALALLATGAEVVAADISPAQLACLELRVAGFRRLEHDELLRFLGVRPDGDRLETFRTLEGELSDAARGYWRARPEWIRDGIIHAGKFERYFRAFRTRVIPCIHRRRTVETLLAEKDANERHRFYDRTWNNARWRLLFRLFFSRFVMGRLGRDSEFFRYVEGSVAGRIMDRARHALTALPTHANPYLHFILTGNYGACLPRYLRSEHFEAVRDGLDRLTLVEASIEEAAAVHGNGGFTGYNLSDIFEYLDPETCLRIYGTLLEHARPGCRFAYWNMLVPRRAPAELADRVTHLDTLSEALADRDLAFFYSAFVVEEVR